MTVTVGSEIDLLSRLYIGHNVPLDVLSRWLGDVEEEVARRVGDDTEGISEYSYEDSPDTPLLIQDRGHRQIYYLYLRAMVDFASGQYFAYANGLGAYRTAVAQYVHDRLCARDRGEEQNG